MIKLFNWFMCKLHGFKIKEEQELYFYLKYILKSLKSRQLLEFHCDMSKPVVFLTYKHQDICITYLYSSDDYRFYNLKIGKHTANNLRGTINDIVHEIYMFCKNNQYNAKTLRTYKQFSIKE